MGLFSAHGRLLGSTRHRWPIRIHSGFGLRDAWRVPVWLFAAGRGALDDARVVSVLLVLAALALAVEMAVSFHAI